MAEILLPSEAGLSFHVHTTCVHSRAGFLEAEGTEKTQRFKQKEIQENVVVEAARKVP